MYEVVITDYARKHLKKLKKYGQETLLQIRRVLAELEADPIGMTTPLHSPLNEYRSLHSGRFRAVIKIVDKEVRVYVIGVGWHESGSREDIYARIHRAIIAGAISIPGKIKSSTKSK